MGFKNNFIDDINEKLMERREPGDVQTTLNIPEHKFKKIAEKFNYALRSVYEENIDKEVKMFHILLSLQEYFDMEWLVSNVLDDENSGTVLTEMSEDFNLKKPKKLPNTKFKNSNKKVRKPKKVKENKVKKIKNTSKKKGT